jgi:hypothetical protein
MKIRKGNTVLSLLQTSILFVVIALITFLSSDSLRFSEKELKKSAETEVVEKNFESENDTENHEVTFQTQVRNELKNTSKFIEITLINLDHSYSELLPTPPPEA